jgi:hypothetical protein
MRLIRACPSEPSSKEFWTSVNQSRPGRSGTLFKMILVIVLFILVIYLGTIFFVTQDPLWFISSFNELPVRVLVYYNGEKYEYLPGDPDFALLAEAIRQSLDGGVLRQSGIGLGEETLKEAYAKYVTVEAFFGRPVKLHANFYTGHPVKMLFPITGRHSELGVVVLGDERGYQVNPPVLKTLQPLRDALVELNFLIDGSS